MSETQNTTETAAQPVPKTVDPKDLNFLITGDLINAIFAELGKVQYDKVFQTMDVLRNLKRVEVRNNTDEGNSSVQ